MSWEIFVIEQEKTEANIDLFALLVLRGTGLSHHYLRQNILIFCRPIFIPWFLFIFQAARQAGRVEPGRLCRGVGATGLWQQTDHALRY